MHRITPIDEHLPSPYELLTGRKPKSVLPSSKANLRSKHPQAEVHQKRNEETQATQAKFYNRKAGRDREILTNSQPVYVQNTLKNIWEPGKVLNRPNPEREPRTYAVEMDNKIYTRTRQHLRPRKCSKPTPEDDHNITLSPPPMTASTRTDVIVQGNKADTDKALTATSTALTCSNSNVNEPKEKTFQLRSHVTRSGRTTQVPSKYKD